MEINKDKFWAKCLDYIQTRIPDQAFQTWFDDVEVQKNHLPSLSSDE